MFLIFFIGLYFHLPSTSQCSCSNCPVTLPNSGIGEGILTISGATSSVLNTTQFVQAVNINVNHDALRECEITLIAPNGSSILLSDNFGIAVNNNITYEICILDCTGSPVPDPGFPINFTSNANYQSGQIYTGSYFTVNGACLSTLSGPVNGQWILRFQDFIGGDGGILNDWSLEFADNTGTACTYSCASPNTCTANGTLANIPQNQTYCEGSPNLDFNLTITSNPVLDPNLFSTTFLLQNTVTQTTLEYDPNQNFIDLPPGMYSICGLVYLTSDGPSLPPINGTNLVPVIQQQIDDNIICAAFALFDCWSFVVVEELDQPITIEGPETVCAGQLVAYNINNPYGNDIVPVVSITMGSFSFFQIVGDQVNVVWLSGPGTLCVSASNACGSVEDCIQITVTSFSENFTLTGPDAVCLGDEETYTLNPVLPPGFTNSWSVTNAVITAQADNSVSIFWNGPGVGEICYNITDPCGNVETVCFQINIQGLAPTPIITLAASVCLASDFQASIINSSLYTSIDWTVNSGTILSGQGSDQITVTPLLIGPVTVCVEITSDCGPPQTVCEEIQVTDPPIPDIIVISQCGDFAELAVVNPITGASYVWTQLSGPSLLSFGNPTFSNTNALSFTPGTYVIQVTENLNGCIGTNTVSVTFDAAFVINNVIQGTVDACVGQVEIYILDPELPPSFTNTWSINNGTITSQSENAVTVLWNNSGSGQICYNITDPCNNMVANCLTVNIQNLASTPFITLPASACEGANFQASIISSSLYTSITWTANSGTILSGQGSNQISVNAISAGTTSICVEVTSLCSPPQSICQNIQIIAPPLPTITILTQCGLSSNLTASVPNGFSFYNWSQISGPSAISFSTPNSASTEITATLPGTYIIQLSETLNVCAGLNTIVLTLQPDLLISNLSFDCNSVNGYIVSFSIDGGLAPYAVDNNSIIGDNFTSAIIPFGNGYSFTITDSENCSISISGDQQCPCVSDAGSSGNQLISICEDQVAIGDDVVGTTFDFNDIGTYVLHNNASNTLGTIFASGATPEFTFVSPLQYGVTYYISYIVGDNIGGNVDINDPCLSVSLGQPIIFNKIPIPNAGVDLQICGNTFSLEGINDLTGSITNWSVVLGNNVDIDFPELLSTQVTVNGIGIYQFLIEENNQGCLGSDIIQVEIFEVLTTQISSIDCNPTSENYTVTFSISGGQEPYVVNGDPIAGNTYTSLPINSGAPYNFDIGDVSTCFTSAQGIFNCDCTTQGGTMAITELIVCAEGGSVTATYNNNGISDADDIGIYVLHTSFSNILGNVLATNLSGIFNYQPTFNVDTRYYISYVIGNDLNGTVDFSDPCLGVSPGQPVIFRSDPRVIINPVADTCGLTNLVSINPQSGTNYTWSSNNTNLSFSNANGLQSFVTASSFGTYEVILIANNDVCSDTATINISFNQPVSFGTVAYDCQDTESFNATTSIIGTAPFTSSVPSSFTTANQLLFENLASGSTTEVIITSSNGCENSTNLIFNCACQSTSGTMSNALLSVCEGQTVNAVYNFDGNLGDVDSFIYVLHTSPSAILGTILGTSSDGRFTKTASMDNGTIYYISYISVNFENGNYVLQLCSFVTAGQPVIFYENPSLTWDVIVAPCSPSADFVYNSTFSISNFVLTSSPLDANIANVNQQGIVSDKAGIYTASIEADNNGCIATFTTTFELFDRPLVSNIKTDCNGLEFNTSFEIDGGTAPYFLNGNIPITSPYESDNFTSLANFSFFVEDDRGCVTPLIVETKECNCTTDAGFLTSGNVTLCAGEDLFPTLTENFTLDNDDGLEYILHDGTVNNIGTILLRTKTLPIPYDPSFAGNTFILTRIVGEGDSNGEINLIGECTDFTLGITVTWISKPNIEISLEGFYCEENPILLDIINPIGGILEVTINQTITADLGFENGKLVLENENIKNGDILTYTFTDNFGCLYDLGSDVIDIRKKPNAGTSDQSFASCINVLTAINLQDFMTQADQGGQWYLTGFTNPIPALLNIDESLNTNTKVYYTVNNECGEDTSSVDIIRLPLPDFQLIAADPLCFEQSNGTISIIPQDATQQVNFSINGAQVNDLVIENLPSGQFTIVAVNGFTCRSEQVIDLIEPEAFDIDFGLDLVIDQGESLLVSFNANLAFTDIFSTTWTLPNGEIINEKTFDITFIGDVSGQLRLEIFDNNGCSAQDSIQIKVNEIETEIILPNVILPSSSVNGFFTISDNTAIKEVTECVIFDRWGNKVYSIKNTLPENVIWDGSFGGKDCQPGVYIYKLALQFTNGEKRILAGDITVLR